MHERDFFREPLSEAELRGLLGAAPPRQAFAWRSPRARAMGLDPKDPPTDGDLIRLMLENPYLLRRPAIRIGGRTVFGFDRAAVKAMLG